MTAEVIELDRPSETEDLPNVVDVVAVDEADVVDELLTRGERLGADGRQEDAAEAFREARAVARSAGDAPLVAHTEDRIAASLWDAGRLAAAERHLRTALAIHESGSDGERIGWARYRLGWLLASEARGEARRSEALELLSSARSLAAECDDRHRVASCDEKAAWVLAARGDHAESVSVLHKVVAVFTAIGAEHDAQMARANLAVQLLALGDLEQAEFHLRAVWVANRDAGVHDAGVSTRLARLLADSGRPEEALAILDESAVEARRSAKGELAAHHLTRARACNVAQLRVAAREAAEEAIVTLRGALLPGLHAEALEFLARCVEADVGADDSVEAEQNRRHADALLGEAMALYLVADQPAEARRLAQDLVPTPPSAEDEEPAHPALATGVYL